MDDLLTVDQAAQRLNTTPRFVRRLIEERRIPYHKLGRHVRIASGDLAAYVHESRVNAARCFGNDRRAA
ncbi:excisionase family DNA-binding protein [Dactylosporangium sucinum]|uniref:DNA-binding protein n=1 Tax=Dactylosporangium sucinum TaxID=1424081 RepID=A0A917U1I7_9ACTN|nr:excisionase family DNA-binding protein [Dactylosporangium sucinum]GGM50961.1 DNA-binding protein [Dactylosporangium sucinum]